MDAALMTDGGGSDAASRSLQDALGEPPAVVGIYTAPAPARAAVPTEGKDRQLEPWRCCWSPVALSIAAEAVAAVEAHETRARRRKAGDHALFLDIVDTLIADAMHRELERPGSAVMVSLSRGDGGLGRRDRYGTRVLSKQLPDVLRSLAATGWLTFEAGQHGHGLGEGRRSTFRPGLRLRERMAVSGITYSDLGRRPGAETIILKRAKEAHWDHGGRIAYTDTPTTNAMRAEVEAINAWLAEADITVGGGEWGAIDTRSRHLRRIFNLGSFEYGGRLFGGFWQTMSADARQDITISDQTVTELDYGQVGPRILYGLAGAAPPPGDLYAAPGLEGCREGVKKLINATLHQEALPKRYPKGLRDLFAAAGYRSVSEVTDLLLRHHEPIRGIIGEPNVGFRVMRLESDVMVRVLLTLRDAGVVALPIHDGLVVAQGDAGATCEVMEQVFGEIVGVEAAVVK